MKKFALVLLIFMLVLSFGLVACGKAEATARVARWSDGERYVFNITKTNYDAKEDDKKYISEYLIKGEDPNLMDEIVPDDLSGTYIMEIAVDKDKQVCTFHTKLTLVALYHTYYNDVPQQIKDQLAEAGLLISQTEMRETWFDEEAYGQAIMSTTETTVQFNNDKSQSPISSTKQYNGYYFGKSKQEVSASNIAVDYSKLSKNKVTVTVDGNKQSREIKYNSATDFIDANQLMLYMRSLEKTEDSFQDSPSVQVYDPIYDVVRTATFSKVSNAFKTFLSYKHEVAVGEEGSNTTQMVTETVKAQLNCFAAVIDGQVFMVEMDLPATLNTKENPLNVYKGASATYSKYTTVRFRTGFISYQLADYDGMLQDTNGNAEGAQIMEALKAVTADKKK